MSKLVAPAGFDLRGVGSHPHLSRQRSVVLLLLVTRHLRVTPTTGAKETKRPGHVHNGAGQQAFFKRRFLQVGKGELQHVQRFGQVEQQVGMLARFAFASGAGTLVW